MEKEKREKREKTKGGRKRKNGIKSAEQQKTRGGKIGVETPTTSRPTAQKTFPAGDLES